MIEFEFKLLKKPTLEFHMILEQSHGEDEFVTYEKIVLDNIHDVSRYLIIFEAFFKYENQSRTSTDSRVHLDNHNIAREAVLRFARFKSLEYCDGWTDKEIMDDYDYIIASHIDYDRVFTEMNAFLKDISIVYYDVDGMEQEVTYKLDRI